jgi:hypothetical protein
MTFPIKTDTDSLAIDDSTTGCLTPTFSSGESEMSDTQLMDPPPLAPSSHFRSIINLEDLRGLPLMPNFEADDGMDLDVDLDGPPFLPDLDAGLAVACPSIRTTAASFLSPSTAAVAFLAPRRSSSSLLSSAGTLLPTAEPSLPSHDEAMVPEQDQQRKDRPRLGSADRSWMTARITTGLSLDDFYDKWQRATPGGVMMIGGGTIPAGPSKAATCAILDACSAKWRQVEPMMVISERRDDDDNVRLGGFTNPNLHEQLKIHDRRISRRQDRCNRSSMRLFGEEGAESHHLHQQQQQHFDESQIPARPAVVLASRAAAHPVLTGQKVPSANIIPLSSTSASSVLRSPKARRTIMPQAA